MSIQEIEAAITKLPPHELEELMAWLEEYQSQKNQDRKDRAEIEGKLLAALDAEAVEMSTADWDQMRERVRRAAQG